MKKNLLSIIILALIVVNIAMTGFMLLSVMTTNSQTAKLVSDIAAALELETSGGVGGGLYAEPSEPSGVNEIATFGFVGNQDRLTINLKPGTDGKSHMMVVEVVFSMNTANPDYASYGSSEQLSGMRDRVKSIVTDTLSSYSMEELQNDSQPAKDAIVEKVRELYNSNFIYRVDFSSVLYQ